MAEQSLHERAALRWGRPPGHKLVDGLHAAINAVLSVYEAAISIALEVAEAEVQVAHRARFVQPRLGAGAGREGGGRRLLFGLQVPLPLWNRGLGALARAVAARVLADYERVDGTLRARGLEALGRSAAADPAVARFLGRLTAPGGDPSEREFAVGVMGRRALGPPLLELIRAPLAGGVPDLMDVEAAVAAVRAQPLGAEWGTGPAESAYYRIVDLTGDLADMALRVGSRLLLLLAK